MQLATLRILEPIPSLDKSRIIQVELFTRPTVTMCVDARNKVSTIVEGGFRWDNGLFVPEMNKAIAAHIEAKRQELVDGVYCELISHLSKYN